MKRLISKKTFRLSVLFTIIIVLAMNWQRVRAMTTLIHLDWEGGDDIRCTFGKCVAFDNPYAGVPELLGMSESDFKERYHFGNEQLVDLAAEAEVDVQRIIDILVANEIVWIDQLVEDRYYTEWEGKKAKEDTVSWTTLHVNSPYQDPFTLSAKIIGISPIDLVQEIHSGKTPANVAELNGIDPDIVYKILLQTELEHIEDRLKYGFYDEAAAELDRLHAPKFAHNVVYKEGFYDEFFSLFKLPVLNIIKIPGRTDDLEGEPGFELQAPSLRLDQETVILFSARAIGISKDLLIQELDTGKKIADVANEHNVDPQRVVDELSLVQADILHNLTVLGALNEEDIDSLLKDQNYVIREIVHKVDLSQ